MCYEFKTKGIDKLLVLKRSAESFMNDCLHNIDLKLVQA